MRQIPIFRSASGWILVDTRSETKRIRLRITLRIPVASVMWHYRVAGKSARAIAGMTNPVARETERGVYFGCSFMQIATYEEKTFAVFSAVK